MGDLVLMKIQYKLKLLNVCKWCDSDYIYPKFDSFRFR